MVNTIKWFLNPEQSGSPPIYLLEWANTRIPWMFRSSGSYYFGANSGQSEFKHDEIGKFWRLNARFNIKNYDNEIEKFLEWIKPYLRQGSGEREFYAIVTTEDGEPKIYYLNDE